MRRLLKSVAVGALALVLGAQAFTTDASAAKPPRSIKVFTKGAFTKNLTKDLAPQEDPIAEDAPKWAEFDLTVSSNKKSYAIGEAMDITITAERDCYIIVYYVNSQGKTAVVCPSAFSKNNRVEAGHAFPLVDNKGRQLRQAGPEGNETIQVVATEQPLDVAKLPGVKLPPVAGGSTNPPVTAASPSPSEPAAPAQPLAQATTTVTVADADAFVAGTEKAIRKQVLARCKKLAKTKGKDIDDDSFTVSDSVFGLASLKYTVTK
ncbi:MAG: DUF4384 domain-containing protein [Armatimonadetes bacterium]|nr:DUF4384 domain-containing protein [Armatimonadota bacterium]